MKYISILFFVCASCMCNGQLTEYRMLFPFPYIGDSVAIKHIHEIKILTFYSKASLPALTKPDLITTFRFDDEGRLLSKYIAACDTCNSHPVFIASHDSANIKGHKAYYNSKGQLGREENGNTIDVYGYDKLGRIYFHASVIPISKVDTSYDITSHNYGDNGKPELSIRLSFILHRNAASGTVDTVSSRKSYARYIYKNNRLVRVLADLATKLSEEPRFVINYKYTSRNHWDVGFFDVDENKNTCVWKVEEKQ